MPAGAAVKADAYGLGAREAAQALYEAGCRDFFVSTWAEAEVLCACFRSARAWWCFMGLGPERCGGGACGPRRGRCLNSAEQVARWKEAAAGPAMRRDDRHRHEPARPQARRNRYYWTALYDRHPPQPSRLRRRGSSPLPHIQLERFRDVCGSRACKALQHGELRRDLPRPRLQLRSRSAWPGTLRRNSAATRPRGTSATSSGSIPKSCSGAPSAPARLAAMERPSGLKRTPKPRSSTSVTPTVISALFRRAGRAFAGEFALPVLGRVSMDLIAVGVDAALAAQRGRLGRDRLRPAARLRSSPAFRSTSF